MADGKWLARDRKILEMEGGILPELQLFQIISSSLGCHKGSVKHRLGESGRGWEMAQSIGWPLHFAFKMSTVDTHRNESHFPNFPGRAATAGKTKGMCEGLVVSEDDERATIQEMLQVLHSKVHGQQFVSESAAPLFRRFESFGKENNRVPEGTSSLLEDSSSSCSEASVIDDIGPSCFGWNKRLHVARLVFIFMKAYFASEFQEKNFDFMSVLTRRTFMGNSDKQHGRKC